MNWNDFITLKEDFRNQVEKWNTSLAGIKAPDGTDYEAMLRTAAQADGVPEYPIENRAVYNTALDDLNPEDDIKIIVIGDNPGKSEQLQENQKYLVGQAGKLADGFFKKNPGLGVDFRRNVIILNKTPVHTAKTKELEFMMKLGGPAVSSIIQESQIYMAELAFKLQQLFSCELWLVGYGELKPRKLFSGYRDLLLKNYSESGHFQDFLDNVLVFQHFSMNCFNNDLKKRSAPELSLPQNLQKIGQLHRKEIFGL